MKDIFETAEPEPFETRIFMKFSYDAHRASRAAASYRDFMSDGMSHDKALEQMAVMHNQSLEQVTFWLEEDQSQEQLSN